VESVRDRITGEYFRHKEFLFDLRSLRADSIYRSESGLEISMRNVHWRRIPDLILSLEKRFRLESFSAVDNTGKGVFEVRIVLR